MLKRLLRHPLVCLLATLLLGGLLSFALTSPLRQLLLRLAPANDIYKMSVGPLVSALLFTVAALAVGRFLQRERPAQLGFAMHRFGRELGAGFGVGAALMGFVVGLFALLGWYRLEATGESLGEEVREVLLYLYTFAVVAYAEELAVRGILFRLIEEWLGSAVALLLSSAFFGAMHLMNPDATVFSSVAIALEAGLLLGAAYMLTRSLWFAVGIHWAWNWVQGPLLGVDVSGLKMDGLLDSALVGPSAWTGGAFGAEGGYVALLVCTAAGVALAWAAARRGQWRPLLSWRHKRRAERASAAATPVAEPVQPTPAG
jgi:uncharacterized protein